MTTRVLSREHVGRLHGKWTPAGEIRVLLHKGTTIYQDLSGMWVADLSPTEILELVHLDDVKFDAIDRVEVLREVPERGSK